MPWDVLHTRWVTSAKVMAVIVCEREELEALIEAAVRRVVDAQTPQRDLLTAKEAGVVLNVHHGTVLRWAREAGLPSHRIGAREVRFTRPELVQWAMERNSAQAS